MKEYYRNYPLFSLCGLNCGLCPRYHTQGESKCPAAAAKILIKSIRHAQLLTAIKNMIMLSIAACVLLIHVTNISAVIKTRLLLIVISLKILTSQKKKALRII
jgi:hypothetical protein